MRRESALARALLVHSSWRHEHGGFFSFWAATAPLKRPDDTRQERLAAMATVICMSTRSEKVLKIMNGEDFCRCTTPRRWDGPGEAHGNRANPFQ